MFSLPGALVLALLFLFLGKDSWFVREVVVSVGLKSPVSQICQVFWTEDVHAPFAPERSQSVLIGPSGVPAEFSLPVGKLEKLRVDFGDGSAPVRAGPVRVSGRDERTLDWNDFTVFHDIARFDVDAKGAVDVVAGGGDPHAVCPIPLDIKSKLRINLFAASCFVLLAILFWLPLAGPQGLIRNPSPRDGEPVCTKAFLMLTVLLVVARFALSARLPPYFTGSPWDDLWFLNAADSLLKGQWMGAYDQHTLIKGCFGPMFLALSSFLGIPFLAAETLLYVLSCLFFTHVASRFSKNRLYLAASLALLLFNPLSMSLATFQRVHRNGMPLWLVPFVFGCFFLLFSDCRRSLRTILSRGVAAGFVLWMFQNTREDGIWLWPFVLACLAFSAVRAWKSGLTRTSRAGRALLCLVPLAVFLAGNAAVCLVNWRFYGLPIRNDRDAGYYAEAMRDLYLIEPDSADETRLTSHEHVGHYHGIYWSTICRAFEASPTLERSRCGIEKGFDRWSKAVGYHGRDLYEDKPLFAIRNGVAAEGFYSSLRTSEAYWKAVHEELSAAFEDGRLRSRGVSFTAMCAPLRAKDVPHVFREWGRAIMSAAEFRDTKAGAARSEPFLGKMAWNKKLRSVSGERFLSADEVALEHAHIERVNQLGRVYSRMMPGLLFLALAAFGTMMYSVFARSRKQELSFDGLILATGVWASFFLHTACIAYVSATTFWATRGSYMAVSYQLELMFAVASSGLFFRFFEDRTRGKTAGARPTAFRGKERR